MKKIFVLVLASLLLSWSAQAVVVHYTADDETIFPNPERGYTDELGGETMLSDSKNHVVKGQEWYFSEKNYRSLVVLMYYLGNYKEQALSDKILQGFDEDMQILRDKGFKCVLRFAYSWKNKTDASKDQVLAHIAQLKPYLSKNADVIYVLEAGFVGQWGEWYYSSHFGNESQHLNTNRRAVLEAMIDACPANRFLLVRYPMIKGEYLGKMNQPDTNPLTSDEAFSGSARARIGHHNDAFLNEWGNDGTYVSWDEELADDPSVRQYIADETLFVPNGGETNVEGSDLASQVYNQAEAEMSKYHWSFCGESYSEKVTNKWRSSGIFNELNRKMGYRYQLVSGSFSDKGAAGGYLWLEMQIKNVGYAPLYNERPAYIVLRSTSNQQSVYRIQLASDPRRWLPNGVVTTISERLVIPEDVPNGTYELYLHLPDASATLATNPKYAIRFANTDVWDASTGMNKLNATLTITPDVLGVEEVEADPFHGQAYDILGRPVDDTYHGFVIQNGEKHIK